MNGESRVAFVTGAPRGIGCRIALTLADPEQSAFVNGHTLSVDGGWYGDGGWESLGWRKQAL